MNVSATLREMARQRPDAPAVVAGQPTDGVHEGRVATYREFDRIVDAVARRAIARGLRPGDHVSLALRAHFPTLALRLAFARAGIASCTVGVPGASARIALRAGSADGVPEIVADPSWWAVPAADDALPLAPGGDALLALQSTSGTSGTPKSVPVTHAQLMDRIASHSAYPYPADVRLLCTSGPSGGLGFQHVVRTFMAGGTVILASSAENVLDLIERHRVNVLVSSPNAVAAVAQALPAGAPPPASLEQIILSGAHLPRALLRMVSTRLCDAVICQYGSTEVGPIACGYARDMRDIDGATGFLVPGAAAEVLDEAGRPLPPGSTGLLRVRSSSTAASYFAEPAASARAFRDGWFHPGDVGMVTEDGLLVIQGRNDDLINVGGSKFAPEAFEEILRLVPSIRDAVAFGVPDGLGKQVIHAAIVVDGDIDIDTIRHAFRAQPGIPPPNVVLRVAGLPRDEGGKVRRDALVRYALSMSRQAAS